MKTVTCTAPVNIAVIKYWGKRDETLILPVNDSISVTLSSDQMHAKTTVALSPDFTEDRIWLNGKEESMDNPRLVNCLREVRKRAQDLGNDDPSLAWKVRICSRNNFPTAAGLASSAAGYACLVTSLSHVYGVAHVDVSELARQGSGSACRSVLGGFVIWQMGVKPDGSDSVAKQLFPKSHWPDMRVMILVASDSRKKVPSSTGMKLSVETSDLLKYRAAKVVPERVQAMEKAIAHRDFESFCELTIRDSNQLHAVCLDTHPPCVYMNDTSHAVAYLVHELNKALGKSIVCYTFDAGPNACLFTTQEHVPLLNELVSHFFPRDDCSDFVRGASVSSPSTSGLQDVLTSLSHLPVLKNSLQYVINTSIGDGPEILTESESLLDASGLPK